MGLEPLSPLRIACEEVDYASIIKRAISFGNDTDTTAAIAGGIGGIRHGKSGIPSDWLQALRGQEIAGPLIEAAKRQLIHPQISG